MKVFLIAPSLGASSHLTLRWADKIYEWCQKESLQTVDLRNQEAVRHSIIPALKVDKGNRGLVVFVDHGARTFWMGSDKKGIVHARISDGPEKPREKKFPDYLSLFKNKFIFAIACRSATTLGHQMLRRGAHGFIGYNGNFQIPNNAPEELFECMMAGLESLVVENARASDARQSMVEQFEKWREKVQEDTLELKSGQGTERHDMITKYLLNNRDFLVHLGDPNWKLNLKR